MLNSGDIESRFLIAALVPDQTFLVIPKEQSLGHNVMLSSRELVNALLVTRSSRV